MIEIVVEIVVEFNYYFFSNTRVLTNMQSNSRNSYEKCVSEKHLQLDVNKACS